MTHSKDSNSPPRTLVFGSAALWVFSYLGARAALKSLALEPWLKITVAVAPAVSTALFLWCVIRGIRSLDELERRMHLEALAFAFPLSILLLWTLGLLQLAIALPPEDWSYRHVWIYLPLLYFAGLAIAKARYE